MLEIRDWDDAADIAIAIEVPAEQGDDPVRVVGLCEAITDLALAFGPQVPPDPAIAGRIDTNWRFLARWL